MRWTSSRRWENDALDLGLGAWDLGIEEFGRMSDWVGHDIKSLKGAKRVKNLKGV